MICRKCNKSGTITIKKDYTYCEICYVTYLNHKFRACIGKNKVIIPNEKILVGLSGGLGSTALLDFIHSGITLNSHKKLRIEPKFVHLTGTEDCNDTVAKTLVEQCTSYGFDIQIYKISSFSASDCKTTSTITSNDFVSRIISNALASVAKEMECRLIFTAEPSTNLAAKMLSDIVIGRGSQVEHDIGFVDNRHRSVKILRPLRDISKEELQHYLKIKGLLPACNHNNKFNNLQSVIDGFVAVSEKDSPSTISTICKTADKIGCDEDQDNKETCIFCKGRLDSNAKKLTAIQATTFSKIVSYKKGHEIQMEQVENDDQHEIVDQSMFPLLLKHLCYCCSRNYAEMDDFMLKEHIEGLILKK